MATSRARRLVDADTGELLEARTRTRHHYRADESRRYYMLVGALALQEIERADYDGPTLRLLLHVIRTARQPTGAVEKTQAELALAIGTSQSTISRAVRVLIEDGHLFRRGRFLFLNPETAFMGNGDAHGRAVADVPDDVRSKIGTQEERTRTRTRARSRKRLAVVGDPPAG